jgi:hypothetical protein
MLSISVVASLGALAVQFRFFDFVYYAEVDRVLDRAS